MAEDLLAVVLADGVMIEDDSGNQLSVRDLRAFNESILRGGGESIIPPLSEGPVHYTMGSETVQAILTISSDNLMSLTRAPAGPIQVVDPTQAADDIAAIFALLKSGRSDDLLLLLDQQIRIRQNDLTQLRRLLYVHQTALQNAVDIVQTKRIDFLEQKKDTWTDGAFGALFLAIVFTAFPPEAVIGQALFALSKGAVRTFGAKVVSRLFSAERGPVVEEIAKLKDNVNILRRFSELQRQQLRNKKFPVLQKNALRAAQRAVGAEQRLTPEGARAALGKTEELIKGLQSLESTSKENEKQYLDFLVSAAAQRVDHPKGVPSVLGKAIDIIVGHKPTLVEEALPSGKTPAQPPKLPATGTPIDIALKNQVQEVYASLVFTAEEVLAALEDFRSVCAFQSPGPDELRAFAETLVIEEQNKTKGDQQTNISAKDVQELVNTSTEAYEQLIWILMYGNQLVRRETFEDETFAGTVITPLPPRSDPDHELLLEYLKTRFYPELETLQIGETYETIFAAVGKRSSSTDAGGTLDWTRFAKPPQILELIKTAQLRNVTLPHDPLIAMIYEKLFGHPL